ncbi:response regulator transcription factor [Streptomyces sp. B21-105]|uniref:response regulator transcription factor n=1 Tax=Streptomyces sp. B21-105 TaxID=3039417 RepID=UPI002FF16669
MEPDTTGGDDVIKVAAVDDHPVLLDGIAAHFARHGPDIRLVATAEDVDELLDTQTGDDAASVVLLDLRLRDGSDIASNVRRLRAAGARVLVYTGEQRPALVRRALDEGALGLVLKEDPPDRLVQAIRTVDTGEMYVSSRLAHSIVSDPRGRVRLSARQAQVLELIAKGLPYTDIACKLHINEETVHTHRKRAVEAYAKAGEQVGGTGELVYRVVADGHIDIGPDLPEQARP